MPLQYLPVADTIFVTLKYRAASVKLGSFETFAAKCPKVSSAGQSGLVHLRLLPTQHSFALAVMYWS